eukprot:gene3506-664_t
MYPDSETPSPLGSTPSPSLAMPPLGQPCTRKVYQAYSDVSVAVRDDDRPALSQGPAGSTLAMSLHVDGDYIVDSDKQDSVAYENANGSVHDLTVGIYHPGRRQGQDLAQSGSPSLLDEPPCPAGFASMSRSQVVEPVSFNLTLLTKMHAGPDNRPAREVSFELGALFATLATRDLHQVLAVTKRVRRSAVASKKDAKLDPVAMLLASTPTVKDKGNVPRTQKVEIRLPLVKVTMVDDAELGQNLLRVSVTDLMGSLCRDLDRRVTVQLLLSADHYNNDVSEYEPFLEELGLQAQMSFAADGDASSKSGLLKTTNHVSLNLSPHLAQCLGQLHRLWGSISAGYNTAVPTPLPLLDGPSRTVRLTNHTGYSVLIAGRGQPAPGKSDLLAEACVPSDATSVDVTGCVRDEAGQPFLLVELTAAGQGGQPGHAMSLPHTLAVGRTSCQTLVCTGPMPVGSSTCSAGWACQVPLAPSTTPHPLHPSLPQVLHGLLVVVEVSKHTRQRDVVLRSRLTLLNHTGTAIEVGNQHLLPARAEGSPGTLHLPLPSLSSHILRISPQTSSCLTPPGLGAEGVEGAEEALWAASCAKCLFTPPSVIPVALCALPLVSMPPSVLTSTPARWAPAQLCLPFHLLPFVGKPTYLVLCQPQSAPAPVSPTCTIRTASSFPSIPSAPTLGSPFPEVPSCASLSSAGFSPNASVTGLSGGPPGETLPPPSPVTNTATIPGISKSLVATATASASKYSSEPTPAATHVNRYLAGTKAPTPVSLTPSGSPQPGTLSPASPPDALRPVTSGPGSTRLVQTIDSGVLRHPSLSPTGSHDQEQEYEWMHSRCTPAVQALKQERNSVARQSQGRLSGSASSTQRGGSPLSATTVLSTAPSVLGVDASPKARSGHARLVMLPYASYMTVSTDERLGTTTISFEPVFTLTNVTGVPLHYTIHEKRKGHRPTQGSPSQARQGHTPGPGPLSIGGRSMVTVASGCLAPEDSLPLCCVYPSSSLWLSLRFVQPSGLQLATKEAVRVRASTGSDYGPKPKSQTTVFTLYDNANRPSLLRCCRGEVLRPLRYWVVNDTEFNIKLVSAFKKKHLTGGQDDYVGIPHPGHRASGEVFLLAPQENDSIEACAHVQLGGSPQSTVGWSHRLPLTKVGRGNVSCKLDDTKRRRDLDKLMWRTCAYSVELAAGGRTKLVRFTPQWVCHNQTSFPVFLKYRCDQSSPIVLAPNAPLSLDRGD